MSARNKSDIFFTDGKSGSGQFETSKQSAYRKPESQQVDKRGGGNV
jgi:hypothetical protein